MFYNQLKEGVNFSSTLYFSTSNNHSLLFSKTMKFISKKLLFPFSRTKIMSWNRDIQIYRWWCFYLLFYMYHITWTKISGVELKMNYTNTYRFLVLKFNILNLKRSNFCNLQNFVELYYLLHLMIERKHLHFSSQSLLRERRLCTINHVLEIHNNTTKKFSNFFLFFVLVFVISKQGEKGFL